MKSWGFWKGGGGGSRYYEDEDTNNVFHFFSCVMDMNRINPLPVVPNTA